MPEQRSNIKIRVRSGDSEAEVEAPLPEIREAIDLIPAVLGKLPSLVSERSQQQPLAREAIATGSAESPSAVAPSPTTLPTVTIEKGDSLSEVISKFFADSWGRNPRKLLEVREALSSYGLNYPKQSVAVALLRLAKGSKIRRFKGEGGEYVYTAVTGVGRVQAPMQATGVQHPTEEPHPAIEASVEPEEQLNLDPTSAN